MSLNVPTNHMGVCLTTDNPEHNCSGILNNSYPALRIDWMCFVSLQRTERSGDIMLDLTNRNISDYLVKTYPTLIRARWA